MCILEELKVDKSNNHSMSRMWFSRTKDTSPMLIYELKGTELIENLQQNFSVLSFITTTIIMFWNIQAA